MWCAGHARKQAMLFRVSAVTAVLKLMSRAISDLVTALSLVGTRATGTRLAACSVPAPSPCTRCSVVGRTLTGAQDAMASMMLDDDHYVDGHLLGQCCSCRDFILTVSTMREFPLTSAPSYGWILVRCTNNQTGSCSNHSTLEEL